METTLIYTGIACVIAAIIGGGLKAFQIEMPVFSSVKRQILLAVAGGLLIFSGIVINYNKKDKDENNRNEEKVEQKSQVPITATDFANTWKQSLEYKNIELLGRASGIPFTFQNEFIGDSIKLKIKYENFFQNKGKLFSNSLITIVFGGGMVGDSIIMRQGMNNDAFKQSRENILQKLSINTEIKDSDYFFIWVYDPLPNSHDVIQCSILLRSFDSKYQIIAFSYE